MKSARIVLVLMFFVVVGTSFSQSKWMDKNGYWESEDTLVGTPIQAVVDQVDSTKYWVLSIVKTTGVRAYHLYQVDIDAGACKLVDVFDSTKYRLIQMAQLSSDGRSLVLKGLTSTMSVSDTTVVFVYSFDSKRVIKSANLHPELVRIDYNSTSKILVWAYHIYTYPRGGNTGGQGFDGRVYKALFSEGIKSVEQIDNRAVSVLYNDSNSIIINSVFWSHNISTGYGADGSFIGWVQNNTQKQELRLTDFNMGSSNEAYNDFRLLRNARKNCYVQLTRNGAFNLFFQAGILDSNRISGDFVDHVSTLSQDGEYLISAIGNNIVSQKLTYPHSRINSSSLLKFTKGFLFNLKFGTEIAYLDNKGKLFKESFKLPSINSQSDFQVSDVKPNVGDTIVFNPLVTSTQAKLKWYFGDGATSTEYRPKHFYKDTGSYTVSLVSTTNKGDEQIIKKNFVRVVGKYVPLEVDFEVSRSIGNPGMEVQFTPKTKGAVRSYKWSFGDGEYSTAKDAFHQYNSIGLFDVTLEVWDSVSSKKITKQNLVGIDSIQFKVVDLKFLKEWRHYSSSSGSANDHTEESKYNSLAQTHVGESGCIKTNIRLDSKWTRTVSYGGSSGRDDRRYLYKSIFEIDSDKILNRVNSNYGCITGVDLTSKQILSFSLVPTNEFIAQQSFYPFGSNPNCPVQDQFKDKIFVWTDTTVQERKPIALIRHRFKNWNISDSTSFYVFHEYLSSPIDSSNWCLYNGSTQLLQQRVFGNSFPVYSDASSVELINFSPIKVPSDESWFDRVAISNVGSVIDSVRTPCVGNFTPHSFISVNGNAQLFIGTNTKDSCGEIRIIDKENKIRYRQIKHYTSLDHIARLDDSTYSISGTLKNRTTGLCVYRLSDSIVREYRFNPDVFGAASLTNHGKTFLAVSSGGGDVFFYKGDNPDVDSLLLGVGGQNQEEESSNLQLRLLPNPADELVHITCSKPNSTVIVTDVLGKEHYRDLTSNTITFDLHSLQSGVYFITAIQNGKRTTVPLAVHH